MEALEQYILDHSEPEPALLADLNRQTHLKVLQPRMLSGHLQGRFLSMVSRMIRPSRILEIGTYTGYSALCMAEGLTENGELHTFESNDELTDFAAFYFTKSKFKDRIIQHVGDAIKLIPNLGEEFDLAFIDGDKTEYYQYFEVVFPVLRKGGFVLIDNTLWSGKVIQASHEQDESAQAIIAFNKFIKDNPEVSNMLLPLRDGLTLVQKI